MKNKIFFLLFIVCLGGVYDYKKLSAQSIKADSLLDLLSKTKEDTSKVKLLLNLASTYNDTSTCYSTYLKAWTLAEKIQFKTGEALACNSIGYYYMFDHVNYPLATAWYTRSMKICTQGNIRSGLAQCYHQLGVISLNFHDFETAIEYFRKAIAINIKTDNEKFLKLNYNMLGDFYMQKHNFDSALFYFKLSEHLCLKNKMSTAVLYVNISSCFISMNELDSARKYIHKTDSSYVAKKSMYGKHWVNLLNGEVELASGNAKGAVALLLESYNYSVEHDDNELMNVILPPLIKAYREIGDYKNGFLLQEKLVALNDSINGTNNASAVLAIERKFEQQQQAEIDQLTREKKDADHKIELNHQRSIISGVVGLLVLISLVAIFIFRGYRQKQKTNLEISRQKDLVEEKQKEILDSIRYAKRIQQSMMPTEKYIDKQLRKNIK